ncbi:MAG: aldehyde dehydrogenase [Rubrimonas sp.]|uniref:aldehyde dehydrogenase n=1 Tax=Rubrimonas sp. TaxID=2036015 RepID=UPI002FDC9F75
MLRLSAAVFAILFAGAAPAADYGLLVNEPGAEVTYYSCIQCHSERIIAQQGLTRDRWADLLVWMVEEQGMQPLDEEDREIILDYLSTHYNTDRPNFPR